MIIQYHKYNKCITNNIYIIVMSSLILLCLCVINLHYYLFKIINFKSD